MKPEFLNAKDKVAIIAPSGRVFKKDLESGLEYLNSLGLEPILGQNIFNDYFEGYHYAGNIEERTADLQWALNHTECKAIWCARGGYGAVHLLDKVDWSKFQENPKWLIGYSDITVLHNQINNFNIESLHGLTIKKLDCDYTTETFDSLKIALFGQKLKYEIESHPFNKIGSTKGKLVGGNLSLIYSLIGSETIIKGEDLILFIEDWFENWYHLDRMLMNLKRAGLLTQIKGLLVGSFTRMDVEEENPNFNSIYDPISYQIIHKFMQEYDIPIGFGFPAGHSGDNRALILGSKVEFTVSKEKLVLDFI